MGKEFEKKINIWITESLFCTTEIQYCKSTIVQYETKLLKKKF